MPDFGAVVLVAMVMSSIFERGVSARGMDNS
jgi:hypothetical protein